MSSLPKLQSVIAASRNWPENRVAFKEMQDPLRKATLAIAKQTAKEMGWEISEGKAGVDKYGSKSLILKQPVPKEKYAYYGAIEISFLDPKDSEKVHRDFRSPWPSFSGIQYISGNPHPLLYGYEYPGFKNLKDLQRNLSEWLKKIMAKTAGYKYTHMD